MSRIEVTFRRLRDEGRAGVAIYLTAGFPTLEETVPLALAALAGGADILELGVPFSDPLADGATIQRASSAALLRGVNLETCLEAAASVRASYKAVPILLMGYYNPFLHYGPARLAASAQAAGVDGLIVPDLPPEEAGPLDDALRAAGLDLIFLLAPTSTDGRVAAVSARARGFIYCVSLTGVTGARAELPASARDLLHRVRQQSALPLAVGFGIARPEQVRALAPRADAIVIGSAFIDLIERTPSGERAGAVEAYVRQMIAAAGKVPTARGAGARDSA